MPLAKKEKKVKGVTKFKIDLTNPIDDGIIDIKKFEAFLKDKIKVEGKVGNLGNRILVTSDKKVVTVTANIDFSKRYLKYLTKKFLKKSDLRDWLRVVATEKDSYTLRYFDINNDENDEDDDE
ncbi:large ribosomal subunit protein eL22-like [Convolutriloba macropyga]|uniref:large ribosomal subunit protein eL22-like n=1 Tax=Convolutriloba macropyga TaxID=536237 RepID=UPI003F5273BD